MGNITKARGQRYIQAGKQGGKESSSNNQVYKFAIYYMDQCAHLVNANPLVSRPFRMTTVPLGNVVDVVFEKM